MQNYKITHYYDFSLKTVCYLLMDHQPPIYELIDLPNVSQAKLLEEKDLGDKKLIRNEWCVHGQIPKLAQKIIKPDMLTFIEDSVWDRKTLIYSTKIIPHHFKKVIDAHHKVEFFDNKDGRTKRILSGVFEVKIPLIGPIFEIAVLQQLKQNCEVDFKLGNDALKKYIAKNGDPNAAEKPKKK